MNGPDERAVLTERRTERRTTVMLIASVELEGRSTRVLLVNLSKRGSSIIGNGPIGRWSITLTRNGAALRGRVMWTIGDRGGIQFEEPVDPREMLRSIPVPRAVHPFSARRPALRNLRQSRTEKESIRRCANLLGVSLREPVR